MKFLLNNLILSFCFLFTVQASASTQNDSVKVATAIPVIASMAQELTDSSNIHVVLLPPEKYSIKRIPGWLQRTSAETFPTVDAVIGISSVWPNIDAYPALRAKNIGVIQIDAAQALMPNGEKVAVLPSQNRELGYFWLNPANALIMLGIIKRDLMLVAEYANRPTKEQDIAAIKTNFSGMNAKLRKSQIELSTALDSSPFITVTSDRNELLDLLSATLLPTVNQSEAMNMQAPTLIVTNRSSGHSSFKDLPLHMAIWSVDDFSRQKEKRFTQRWEMNVQSLVEVLSALNSSSELE